MNWKTVKSYLEQDSLAKYIEALGKAGFGIAAIVAACQTGTVLNEVAKVKQNLERIEDLANKIDSSNIQIKNSSDRLESANREIIKLINSVIVHIGLPRTSKIPFDPEFQKNDSPENLNLILKRDFSKPDQFGIYLRDKERSEIIKAYNAGEIGKSELPLGVAQKLSSTFFGNLSEFK